MGIHSLARPTIPSLLVYNSLRKILAKKNLKNLKNYFCMLNLDINNKNKENQKTIFYIKKIWFTKNTASSVTHRRVTMVCCGVLTTIRNYL